MTSQVHTIIMLTFTFNLSHRRTGRHPFGGADRVLPEWIQWGGGVVAEIFRDPCSVGGGVVAEIYYVGWENFFFS